MLLSALALSVASGDETNIGERFPPIRAETIIGMKAENTDGLHLGRVRDFVLDMQTGRVKYVLVASGGLIGIRSKLRAVPPEMIYAGTAKRDTVAMSVSERRWKSAPVLSSSPIKALSKPGEREELARFYKVAAAEAVAANTVATNAEPTTHRLTPVGRAAGERAPPSTMAALRLASDLIGQPVGNRKSEKIGDVTELLISLEPGVPAFAIVSTGRLFPDRQRRFAVPLRALGTGEKRRLTLDANRELLAQVRRFNNEVWQATSPTGEPEIFRY